MNQDLSFEDAFKMRNLLENLREKEVRHIVSGYGKKSYSSESIQEEAPSIIGIREHIFTGILGVVTCISCSEVISLLPKWI